MSNWPFPKPKELPDEIKKKMLARLEANPGKVVWAMCSGGDWYVYAHSAKMAKAGQDAAQARGDKVWS